jgi:hypothetical protein
LDVSQYSLAVIGFLRSTLCALSRSFLLESFIRTIIRSSPPCILGSSFYYSISPVPLTVLTDHFLQYRPLWLSRRGTPTIV